MIPFAIIRRMLLSLAPLALFYLLRKVSREQHLPKRHVVNSTNNSTYLFTCLSRNGSNNGNSLPAGRQAFPLGLYPASIAGPFPCRHYDRLVVFSKISPSIPCFLSRLAGSEISSSNLVQWLSSYGGQARLQKL